MPYGRGRRPRRPGWKCGTINFRLYAGNHPSPAFAGAPLKGEPISYFRFAMDAKRPEGWFSATNLKTSAPLGPGTVKTVPYRLFYCAQRAINAYLTHRGAHCAPADVCLIAGWRNIRAIPHNSKCRYGERGAAAAKPKAQIILDVLSSILATQMPCRSRRSGA